MLRSRYPLIALVLCCTLVAASAPPASQDEEEFDAFMEKVLERRVTNWEDLYRYTVRDTEEFELSGPGGAALESYRAESTWYVRDGYMVRSPDRVNGATVGDDEREKAEQEFLERMKRREREREEERRRKHELAEKVGEEELEELLGESLEREYFLGFPFEPGHYYVAGWETLEGMQLVKIEYYPEKLFEDKKENTDPVKAREDAQLSRGAAKTSLITMWVLPEEHQIVRIRYDNVGLEFLPLRWLMQVDDAGAELTLSKPFPDQDLWLPREIVATGKVAVATGAYAFRYSLRYHDYRETEVGARVRFRFPRGMEQQR